MDEQHAATQVDGGEPATSMWHTIGPFTTLGQRFEVTGDDPALLRLLDHLYAPMREGTVAAPTDATDLEPATYRIQGPTSGAKGSVERGGTTIGTSRRRARVLGYLQWAINQQVIQAAARERLILHASAAARDGLAVVMPAAMESGKTTLVTGLLDRGLHYLTDEAASIGDDLEVQGYLKPLSIDEGSWEVLAAHQPELPEELDGYFADQWQIAPHDIGAVATTSRLGLLVFPSHQQDADTTCTRLRPTEAVAFATSCTFGPDKQPISTHHIRALGAIAEAVPAYRLISGDLDAACRAVLDHLPPGRDG